MIRPPSSRTTVVALAFSLVALTVLTCVAFGFDGAALVIVCATAAAVSLALGVAILAVLRR